MRTATDASKRAMSPANTVLRSRKSRYIGYENVRSPSVRPLNAPGPSTNAEIEAVRRLWIDSETLLPCRFQFNYAFPNPDDYSFELVEER